MPEAAHASEVTREAHIRNMTDGQLGLVKESATCLGIHIFG
jgi:hypothetical protein